MSGADQLATGCITTDQQAGDTTSNKRPRPDPTASADTGSDGRHSKLTTGAGGEGDEPSGVVLRHPAEDEGAAPSRRPAAVADSETVDTTSRGDLDETDEGPDWGVVLAEGDDAEALRLASKAARSVHRRNNGGNGNGGGGSVIGGGVSGGAGGSGGGGGKDEFSVLDALERAEEAFERTHSAAAPAQGLLASARRDAAAAAGERPGSAAAATEAAPAEGGAAPAAGGAAAAEQQPGTANNGPSGGNGGDNGAGAPPRANSSGAALGARPSSGGIDETLRQRGRDRIAKALRGNAAVAALGEAALVQRAAELEEGCFAGVAQRQVYIAKIANAARLAAKVDDTGAELARIASGLPRQDSVPASKPEPALPRGGGFPL